MANFAASATQFAGQALVRTASTIAINTATNYISHAFDNRNFEGPRLGDFHLQTSRDGAPMARVYGRVRLAGQVIWASHVREISTENPVGGKGSGPTQTNYTYRISFAVGLCEGEISGVDRIWANGSPLQTVGLDMRVYTGSERQAVDPVIAAIEGADAPSFRGTAYVVFEDFPLDDFGNRLPQLNFEVVRSGKRGGKLENLIRSVNLLPGSGEFAYATSIVEESPRPGTTRPVNMNNLSGKADIELALDQLQAQLPNCENISLISTWFASSTEIATCQIRPGVERRIRNLRHGTWQVGRDDRGSAYIVSTDEEGRPNFGGTPSDESLIQAIQSIKARGLTVTLYPFIMVDAPGFPWRGRMTGQAADVRTFFGEANPSDYSIGTGADHHRNVDEGFRNFILTHANLARRAGGVDRFIIGSEMVGLTTIRDSQNQFPAVTELANLSGDVRTLVGPNTGLSYAADWSEYFGFHPQDESEDIYFHLDALWAHPAITAIGIDAYFPLSDWRESDHIDAQDYNSIYDPNYLSGNVEGGEGYDWYYASDEDRNVQNRTPISDWVYRYKDLRNWWSHEHRNRINGVLQDRTEWQAQSKPIWLTEIGCPAVKFGGNQPNVFFDGKSEESNIPYYSDGSTDNLMQRRYLETLIDYWSDMANNPISILTDHKMIDMSATSVWAWDARPYPDFPARFDAWSDGLNWQKGHWINGRVGTVPLGDVIQEICQEAGLENVDTSAVNGLLSGFVIDRPMRAREALQILTETYDLSLTEHAGEVKVLSNQTLALTHISSDRFIETGTYPIQFSIEEDMSSVRDVRVTYIDASRDYQIATISAKNELAETVRVTDIQVPLVMDTGQARLITERRLLQSESSRRTASFSLAAIDGDNLYAGAILELPEQNGHWQITRLRQGVQTDVDLVLHADVSTQNFVAGANLGQNSDPIWVSEPMAVAFDLRGTKGLQVGAVMDPFRVVTLSAVGSEVQAQMPVKIGALLSPLKYEPPTTWDRRSEIDIWMPNTALYAQSEDVLLESGNRFAIETQKGWEVIAAADITLIGAETYRLRNLLRGLSNSDDDMVESVPAGARLIVLDAGLTALDLPADHISQVIDVSASTLGRDGVSAQVTYHAAHLRPLSVVHLTATEEEGQTRLNWVPRNIDNSTEIDPNAEFIVAWEGGNLTTTGTTALIPVQMGSDTLISVTPFDALTQNGRANEIRV